MGLVFTEYVRQLAPSGEPPDQESFARVWEELRRLLERELRRRGLWNAPPSYLGIYGRARWREGAAAAESGPGVEDGLEELVAELYPYVFIDRLNKLVDYLKHEAAIDGLVVLNVRHLLHERQRKHDPLGYRVFKVFHQAVTAAVEAGELFVVKGDARVRNDTVLGGRLGVDPAHRRPVPQEKVAEWNDTLMPGLLAGKGRARRQVVTDLRDFLRRLPGEGVEAFVFREVLDPLKKDARVRWAAHLELAQGKMGVAEPSGELGGSNVVPWVAPDSELEDRESLEKLDKCLAAAFERLAAQRDRADLKNLWQDLYRRAQDGEIPSRRKLAEELEWPRRRLSELFTTLGELIDDCRRVGFARIGPLRAEGGTMSLNSRAETLREQTGQARRRHAEAEARRHRPGRGPRPGDVYLVAGTPRLEWALLREDNGGFHAVPADISPLAEAGDVVVPKEASCGPLTLRCAFGVHLDLADLDPETRTGSLPADILDRARALSGEAVSEAVEDPELEAWIREVVEPARQAVRSTTGRSEAVGKDIPERRPRASHRPRASQSPHASHRRRRVEPFAVAASVLLMVSLGLSWELLRQHREILRLKGLNAAGSESAAGNVPFQALAFSSVEHRAGLDELVLPAGAREVFFLLNVVEFMGEPSDHYRLRLLEKATEDEIWRSDRLTEMKAANLTVKLPVRLIPPGDYLFQLYGLDSDQERPLAEYSLRIGYEL